ncbi:MAG TPA: hypothetical protein VFH95_11900 [Candidatus Kapabacteria bacterium]|nr:hypothetical protein [Candidatus Kapabacteria bacterium]
MQPFNRAYRIIFASGQRSFLVAITFLSLFIRIGFIIFASHPQAILSDPKQTLLWEHGVIANNLYTGHGFSMHWPYHSLDTAREAAMHKPPKWEGSFVAPLNPYLLYWCYVVFGESAAALYALLILYALVSAFIPLTVFKLSLLLGGERSARISTLIALLFLPGAYAVVTFSGSALFQFMGVVILFFATLSAVEPSWKSFLWLGLCCGIMIGLRSEFFFLGPILIVAALLLSARRNFHPSLLLQGVASIAICLAVTVPWTVRNYELYHRFVPVVSHPWWELWRGNNKLTAGTDRLPNGQPNWVNPVEYPRIIRRMDSIPYDRNFEGKVDLVFRSEVINFIETHPTHFLLLAGKKLFYFFTVDPNDLRSGNLFYWLPTLVMSFLIVLGLWCLLRDRTKREAAIPLLIFLAYYLFMTAMTLMQVRYQMYVFTCMLPVTGLITERTKRRGGVAIEVIELKKIPIMPTIGERPRHARGELEDGHGASQN